MAITVTEIIMKPPPQHTEKIELGVSARNNGTSELVAVSIRS